MERAVKTLFYFGPILFGLGFLSPLISQSINALNWSPPLGLTSLMIGLIAGGLLGLSAQIRGRWV